MFRVIHVTAIVMLLSLLVVPNLALAHKEITAGDYTIEYGWLNEPPVASEPNGIVLNISKKEENKSGASATSTPAADHHDEVKVDISGLKVELVYGSESKLLTLQPLRGGTAGQFVARVTPTRAGQYTLRLNGKIDKTDIKAEVKPEEIDTADAIQFPRGTSLSTSTTDSLGIAGWLGVAGLVAGLLGVGISVFTLRRLK